MSHLLEYLEEVARRRSHDTHDFTAYDMTVVHGASGTRFHHGVGNHYGPELSHADVFWRALTVAETHRISKLRLTILLYGIGLLLFAVVATQNLAWVVQALLNG